MCAYLVWCKQVTPRSLHCCISWTVFSIHVYTFVYVCAVDSVIFCILSTYSAPIQGEEPGVHFREDAEGV